MESYAGYRGTSPPNLFVAFDKAQLDMDAGIFTSYEDPLDLKNTFVSWEFGFDGGNKGLGKLTLINPGTQIEDKLFSWYAALSPRSWTARERGYTREELEEKTREVADFFVRWGYQSPANLAAGTVPTNAVGAQDDGALSHIHKFRLLDMGYRISDRGDKIITLTLVNMWELYYNSTDFVQRERLFEVPLTEADGSMRSPSIILQEFLLQFMAAHEQYKGYSKWTDDQFEALDSDFGALLTAKDLASGVSRTHTGVSLPINADDKYIKYVKAKSLNNRDKKNWTAMDCIKEFFGQFGMVPSFMSVLKGSKNDVKEKVTAANQGVGAPNQGTAANPDPTSVQAAENKVAGASEFTEEVIVNQPTLLDNNPLAQMLTLPVPPAPYPMGLPLGAPYIMVFKDKHGIAKTQLTISQISVVEDTNKYFYACNPVFKSQVQDKPWEEALMYLAWSEMWPAPNTSVTEDSDDGLMEYDLASAPLVKVALETSKQLILSRQQEATQELHDAVALEQAQTEVEETLGLLAQLPGVGAGAEETDGHIHTIQYLSKNLKMDLDLLISHLNDKYFKGTSRYLQAGQLEFANVPNMNRPAVEEILGDGFKGMSWDDDNGILLLTDTNEMSNIFEFAMEPRGIKSFPIQSNTKPNTISLATGFNNRPDNIITSLNWSLNQGSMFLELRNTPMVVQKLYNVASRFEDPAYRDVVIGTLALNLHFESAKQGILSNDGNGAGGIAAPELQNQQDVVGAQVFPEAVIKSAQAQAVTMTSFDSDAQDGADVPEETKAALLESVREDLIFISRYDLMDIFFPKVSPDAQDSIRTRYTIVAPQGEDNVDKEKVVPYFRYVTKSPITILQQRLEAQGLEATTENSVLIQAKVQALNVFQKLITDIRLEILGVPEMDIWTNEIQNRSIALWVHEPRVPGTYHWLTGMYTIADFNHKIDSSGYKTTLTLMPKLPNTADEMAKYTFTQIGGGA